MIRSQTLEFTHPLSLPSIPVSLLCALVVPSAHRLPPSWLKVFVSTLHQRVTKETVISAGQPRLLTKPSAICCETLS